LLNINPPEVHAANTKGKQGSPDSCLIDPRFRKAMQHNIKIVSVDSVKQTHQVGFNNY